MPYCVLRYQTCEINIMYFQSPSSGVSLTDLPCRSPGSGVSLAVLPCRSPGSDSSEVQEARDTAQGHYTYWSPTHTTSTGAQHTLHLLGQNTHYTALMASDCNWHYKVWTTAGSKNIFLNCRSQKSDLVSTKIFHFFI